jgi:CHAT domain-containing protein
MLGRDEPSPALIHLATHGFFCDAGSNPGDPALPTLFRSGLLMAGAQHVHAGNKPWAGMEDGILYAFEVANLNLSDTRLVVLSACETARGEIHDGEGVYGLARSFLLAGAEQLDLHQAGIGEELWGAFVLM